MASEGTAHRTIKSIDATALEAIRNARAKALGGGHPRPGLAHLTETGEPLAVVLRPGNAGANTAADHFEVLALALEQRPAQDLDREILTRADIGGGNHASISDCREAAVRFSVGYGVDERVREAMLALPPGGGLRAIEGVAGRVGPIATRFCEPPWRCYLLVLGLFLTFVAALAAPFRRAPGHVCPGALKHHAMAIGVLEAAGFYAA